MPIKIRKSVITISRCQVPYDLQSRAYIRLKAAIDTPFPYTTVHKETSFCNLHDILPYLDDYMTSPILSSFISMLVRVVPFGDREDLARELEAGRTKEIRAAMEEYHPVYINWQSILSESAQIRHRTPFSEHYFIQPEVQDRLYSMFKKCRHDVDGLRLYPDYSHKSIGSQSERNFMSAISGLAVGCSHKASTADLERLWSLEGVKISGPTELRCAFKYNDIRPRFYYARGPDQYYASRFIQPFFNFVLQYFPFVHRFLRFSLHELVLDHHDTLFIYDYDAFTSRLDEIKNFTCALAHFFQGTYVETVDTYHGITRVDLHDLLTEFNDACNMYPAVVIQESLKEAFEDPESFIHTCGMLGVPGNISSCTLLHGLHLCIVVMSVFCRCVGDDAIGSGEIVDKSGLHTSLSSIGLVAEEKMEFWEHRDADEYRGRWDDTWHYIKRPLDRFENRIIHSPRIVIWPPIPAILTKYSDSDHTTYPSTKEECQRKVASTLCSFVRQFEFFSDPSPLELSIANQYIREMLRASGLWRFRKDGSTYAEDLRRDLIFPICVEESLSLVDWVDRIWYSRVRLPVPRSRYSVDREDIRFGVGLKGMKFNRMLKTMVDIGHASAEQEFETVLVKDHVDRVMAFMSRDRLDASFTVCIFESCPLWMFDTYLSECQLLVLPDEDHDPGEGW